MFANQQNQVFAQTTHCPGCGRCFCGTAKLQAIDGTATCANCKPALEEKWRKRQQELQQQPPQP